MSTGLAILHTAVGLLLVGHGARKLYGASAGTEFEGTSAFMESLGLAGGIGALASRRSGAGDATPGQV